MARAGDVRSGMFGCNTYSYMLTEPAESCLDRLADYGFQEFELMVHPGHLWPAELPRDRRRAIRSLLQRRGLKLTTVNLPNVDINIASTTPEMRSYSVNLLAETVRLAGELGAGGVVMSPGKASLLLPAPRDVLNGYFFAALDRLGRVAEECRTALWIENVAFAFEPTIAGLVDLLRGYGNDAVRIVYDIANAYFIEEDFRQGLDTCRDRLALVHLSDTGQKEYRHDPIGQGTLPFGILPPALAAVGYHARPMLEIISRNPDRDILASAEKLTSLGFGFAAAPAGAPHGRHDE